MLLANVLYELISAYKAGTETSVLFVWLYAAGFVLHLYFDFSGYSDMAIGLGRIFGFRFPENFNYPYISASVTEFWRRWHISLGSWFRDYVYIPLGGNRVSRRKQLRNHFSGLAADRAVARRRMDICSVGTAVCSAADHGKAVVRPCAD